MQVIGLNIGTSFADVSVWNAKTSEVAGRAFFYLPRQSLKTALPAFIKSLPDPTASAAFVSTRFLERLFDFRLGGSTAQIVTAGFETWFQSNSAAQKQGLFKPAKVHPIVSSELVYSLDERIDAQGQITKKINLSELDLIVAKLVENKVKRVCLFFVNSHLNSTHEQQVSQILKEKGFEVFLSPHNSADEIVRWRASALEASMSGTFEEHVSEIQSALTDFLAPEKILFHDHEGFKLASNARRIGTLFAEDLIRLKYYSKIEAWTCLHIESWYCLDQKQSEVWQSPWGEVALKIPQKTMLKIQPTSSLWPQAQGDLGFHLKAEGFDPGPMCMGRGRQCLLFDLWSEHEDLQASLKNFITPATTSRTQSSLLALAREVRSNDLTHFLFQLKKSASEWAMAESQFIHKGKTSQLTGLMSPLLVPSQSNSIHNESPSDLILKIAKKESLF